MPNLLTRITIDPEIRSGKPVIRGTRITVLDVLEYMAGGMTHDEILEDFPELSRDDILAVLAFARNVNASPTLHPLISECEMHLGDVVTVHPEIVSGTPVFAGTRVPAESLIQHLAAGDSLDDFLDGFPGVSREQASEFLRMAFDAAIQSICR